MSLTGRVYPDGAEFIVLLPGEEGFVLTDTQRAELTEAMEQLKRGEGVAGWELLRELKS